MAIIREFDSKGRDRSGEDRRRHGQLIKDTIKRNIRDIIAEESIIGQRGDKKIKVPIRGIREYRFIYGTNQPGVGSGNGQEKRGDQIGSDETQDGQGTGQNQAGDDEGEDIYETEITVEELISYLFEDFNLPNLEKKKFSELESDQIFKRLGFQRKGIPPRLAKKKSVMEKIKREKATRRHDLDGTQEEDQRETREPEERGRFPFKEDDLRYHRLRQDLRKDTNAVVICIMDTSGSMDSTKKYLARSFYFLLYQFVKMKYENVEIAFVAHTTTGKEVTEEEFFHKGESGGTHISSGYEKALEIIKESYDPSVWNVYAFHCSDGDNWTEDNERAVELAIALCKQCNLFGYGEIVGGYYSVSTISQQYLLKINQPNFSIAMISKKEDIVPALQKLLEKE